MINVVLMHGKDTDPSKKWYPWLQRSVEAMELSCVAPVLPHANDPLIEEWKGELDDLVIGAETVLIGHSR